MKNLNSVPLVFLIISIFVACSKQDLSTTAMTATINGTRWSTDSIVVEDLIAAFNKHPLPDQDQFMLCGFNGLDSIKIICMDDQGTFTTSAEDYIYYIDDKGGVFISNHNSGTFSMTRQLISAGPGFEIYNYAGNFNAMLYNVQNGSTINITGTFYYKSY